MDIKEALKIEVTEQFNVLDELHNYSYQWRLFMVNELALKHNGFNINSAPQVTIAETGSTSIYINSVSLDSLYAPNNETRSAGRIALSMELIEPNGASFFDLIYTAASELAIENWAKHPLYLQLTFMGYDENGNVRKIEGHPNWIWRIQATAVETAIDAGGSKYTMLGYLVNDTGITENYGIVPKSANLVGNTFLEMVASLEEFWNAYELKNSGTSAAPLVQYKFLFYEDVSANPAKLSWKELTMVESFDEKSGRQTVDTAGGKETKAAFAKSWRIQNVIDTLLSCSSFSKTLEDLFPPSYDDQEVSDHVKSQIAMAKTYKMEAQVIYTGYDKFANDYEKLIVYHIWPFDGVTQILSAAETTGSLEEAKDKARAEAHRARVEALNEIRAKNRIVQKAYNYIFTGKNVDILNFDLRFNSFWKAFLSQQSSINYKGPDSNSTKLLDDTAFYALDSRQQNAILQRKRSEGRKYQLDMEKAARRMSAPGTTREERERIANEYAVAVRGYQEHQSVWVPRYRAEQARGRTVSNERMMLVREGRSFAEDILSEERPTLAVPVPISVDEDDSVSSVNIGQGMEEHFYEGRNFFGALLNQMYSTRLSDWFQIEVEIRGDPHWIGMENVDRFKALYDVAHSIGGIDTANNRTLVNPVGPDQMVVPVSSLPEPLKTQVLGSEDGKGDPPRYQTAEQCFLLNFYTPSVFRDTEEYTGRINDLGAKVPEKSAFISGLYALFRINHRFENGLFTQVITAKRDPYTAQYSLTDIAAGKPDRDARLAEAAAQKRLDQIGEGEGGSEIKQDDTGPRPTTPYEGKISEKGFNFLFKEENIRTKAYNDAGKKAIGVGHQITPTELSSGVIMINGQAVPWQSGISKEQGMALFRQDLATRYERAVQETITAPYTQNEYDAMVILTYNIGEPGFRNSKIAKAFNAGQKDQLPALWREWRNSQGSIDPVLVARRDRELKVLLHGDYGQ